MSMDTSKTDSDANRAEFTRLYRDCQTWLYCYLLSLLRQPADAEEVLQETASICWEKFAQYQHGTEFRAWACRIAHFKALKFRQQKKKAPLAFSELFFELVDEEAVVMADKLDARMAALAGCLQKLPDGDRELIEKRYVQGIDVGDLARSLARSVHAVYRGLRRIHDVLYRCVNRTLAEEGT